ncbi:alpha/beta fold hydrolase [Micromonospora sp. KC213]|uniref:alpha/beta fold hydrolase n=1 Tax=Micromonospora sp. KC213 TaxID=2530378 RepID=UPI00104330F7|nr:alpha/beta fold hydrolase [Micromonospora sp. KC213]TDC42432.1 alpha/beta fold hydrolase [Micromonospora sp. KC213]
MGSPASRVGTAVTVTVALAAGLLTTGATPGGAQSPTGPLVWRSCPADVSDHPALRCAVLSVPLDHRDPQSRHITVTVSRIPATDPARRLGTLVLSPGGPGIGGLAMPAQLHGPGQPPQLGQRYDLVGFDARGVRHSSPVSCGLPVADRAVRYPAPDGSIAHSVAHARATAQACRREAADVLPHITTANTARDLDRIRAALGEERISFFGLSYGTYLGAVYATRHPHRTDRVVLDSALDPNRIWYDLVRLGGLGLTQRLPDLTGWVADRHHTYRLGRTAAAVEHRYRTLLRDLDHHPITYPGLVVDGNWLRDYTRDNLEQPDASQFPHIAAVWQELAAASRAPATGTPAVADAVPATSVPAGAAVPADNRQTVGYAVQCGDAAWPRRPERYAAAVRRDRTLFPEDAGRSATITPCAFWPAPVEAAPTVGAAGPRNILILHNRRDPATPWVSGHGMHQALRHRSTLVTADTGGHGVIGANDCATALALRYLTDDRPHLPASRICPGDGQMLRRDAGVGQTYAAPGRGSAPALAPLGR